MVKKLVIGIFVCLLLVQFGSAIETNVDIKTMPEHEVQVSASDLGGNVLERFSTESDEYGDANFVFDFSNTKYNLFVYIKKDAKKIKSEKQYNLETGEDVYLEIAPSSFEFIETPETTETDTNSSSNETISSEDEETDSEEDEETEEGEDTETEE